MKNIVLQSKQLVFTNRPLWMLSIGVLLQAFVSIVQAQCGPASSFTKITNSGGTATYPGTNGSPAVNVTTTSTGRVSLITFCAITNGFRAGDGDKDGAYRFAFSPSVNGISINLNSLSNVPTAPARREVVQLRINNVLYNITAGNITCSANCFGCAGTGISATGGNIAADADVVSNGNGVGQVLIQGVGPISSIEYSDVVQDGAPQGSVFEIFFNNSTCLLPVTFTSFIATNTALGNQLNWTTTTEQHLNRYEVERSSDGRNFSTLASVPAKNTGSSYRFTDTKPEPAANYYRLAIVNTDGSRQYSKIVVATAAATDGKIRVANPVVNVLTVSGLSANSTISVYTATGKEIVRTVAGSTTEVIETTGWAAGLYIVKVMKNGSTLFTGKVMKQ